jgi:hypothetical protein
MILVQHDQVQSRELESAGGMSARPLVTEPQTPTSPAGKNVIRIFGKYTRKANTGLETRSERVASGGTGRCFAQQGLIAWTPQFPPPSVSGEGWSLLDARGATRTKSGLHHLHA